MKYIPWVIVLILALSILVSHLSTLGGIRYVETYQLERHIAVLSGSTSSPWVYRLLPEEIAWAVGGAGYYPVFGLILTRILATLLALGFTILWWGQLGIDRKGQIIGLVILGTGLFWTFFDSDLSSGTFLEVALCSALCLWPMLAIPLSILAALNRETSILIFPGLILLAFGCKRYMTMIISGAVAFILTYLTVRLAIGYRETMPYYGRSIGWEMLKGNLLNLDTWLQLIRTFSLAPLLALLWWKKWPPVLKRLAVIVPLWVGAVFIGGAVQETRLLLVPFSLVLLPAFLMSVG